MARRRRDRESHDLSHHRPRDPLEIAIELQPMRPINTWLQRPQVRELEDRRRYHPEDWNAPIAASRAADRRLVERTIPPTYPGALHRTRLVVANPSQVAHCVRRQERREVLLAKGRGGKGNRAPKWNARSREGCK